MLTAEGKSGMIDIPRKFKCRLGDHVHLWAEFTGEPDKFRARALHKSARALRLGEFWERIESLKGQITNYEIVLEGMTSERLLYEILKPMAELRSEGLVNQP